MSRGGLFGFLQAPGTQPKFWERVSGDVDWTVQGTHPLAGRYRGKEEFLDATFRRLAGVLKGGAKLEVERVHVDGDITVAELYSTSTTNEVAPFANRRCSVCRFDGDAIVEVRAYPDSAMVACTVLRNEAGQAQ